MKPRTRLARALAAATIGATMVLALPAASAAEHDRYERQDRRQRRHDGGFRFDFGARPRRHHRAYPVRTHGPSCRLAGPRHAQRGYQCSPCGHRFDSLHRLRHHVHHHHRVPLWKLPLVIVARTAGFFVYG